MRHVTYSNPKKSNLRTGKIVKGRGFRHRREIARQVTGRQQNLKFTILHYDVVRLDPISWFVVRTHSTFQIRQSLEKYHVLSQIQYTRDGR